MKLRAKILKRKNSSPSLYINFAHTVPIVFGQMIQLNSGDVLRCNSAIRE